MDCDLEGQDKPEEAVVEQGPEDVDVIGIDNSGVDLVEQVHQDESVEADGVKDESWSCLLGVGVSEFTRDEVEALLEEDEASEVHQDNHYKDLVNCLANNLSPHLGQHDSVSAADTS